MIPAMPCAFRARPLSAKVGFASSLKQLKTTLAYWGTLLLNLRNEPAGMMWSVVILSPHLSIICPLMVLASCGGVSGTTIVGPRRTSIFFVFSIGNGVSIIESSMRK